WILEQYEFPFEVVYPQTLDAGNLNAKSDVLAFVDGGIPERAPAAGGRRGVPGRPAAAAAVSAAVSRRPTRSPRSSAAGWVASPSRRRCPRSASSWRTAARWRRSDRRAAAAHTSA